MTYIFGHFKWQTRTRPSSITAHLVYRFITDQLENGEGRLFVKIFCQSLKEMMWSTWTICHKSTEFNPSELHSPYFRKIPLTTSIPVDKKKQKTLNSLIQLVCLWQGNWNLPLYIYIHVFSGNTLSFFFEIKTSFTVISYWCKNVVYDDDNLVHEYPWNEDTIECKRNR